jgi:hypothetical protein
MSAPLKRAQSAPARASSAPSPSPDTTTGTDQSTVRPPGQDPLQPHQDSPSTSNSGQPGTAALTPCVGWMAPCVEHGRMVCSTVRRGLPGGGQGQGTATAELQQAAGKGPGSGVFAAFTMIRSCSAEGGRRPARPLSQACCGVVGLLLPQDAVSAAECTVHMSGLRVGPGPSLGAQRGCAASLPRPVVARLR